MTQEEFQFPEGLKASFLKWKDTPGGGHVMADLYALAAGYVPRWKRTKIPVAVSLLWELERQRIKEVRARAQRKGVKLEKWEGYTLNNNHRAYVARHIMDRRHDWSGLFETREIHKGEDHAGK